MIPAFRATRLVIEVAPELRDALKREAARQTAERNTHITISDVIRDMLTTQFVNKSGAS